MAKTDIMWLAFWAISGRIQYSFLQNTYLQRLHLVDEIHLLKDLKRIRLVISHKSMQGNIFATIRLNLFRPADLQKEYIFDISDVSLIEGSTED